MLFQHPVQLFISLNPATPLACQTTTPKIRPPYKLTTSPQLPNSTISSPVLSSACAPPFKMVLSFILIQNRQYAASPPSSRNLQVEGNCANKSRGKTRLAKWYAPYNDEEKIKLKGEVYLPPFPFHLPFPTNLLLSSLLQSPSNVSSGPPPRRPPRSKIPIQFRRVQTKQNRLQTLRRPLLLRLRRRK